MDPQKRKFPVPHPRLDVSLTPSFLAVLYRLILLHRLQENLLSRRKLYFAGNRLFFRCQLSEFSKAQQPDDFSPRTITLRGALDGMSLPGYGTLVDQYSRLVMTNQNDILRALADLDRRFSESFGYPIFQGLPTGVLDGALLFHGIHGMKQRRRRNGFPSYSWAGWIGPGLEWLELNLCGAETGQWLDERMWIVWYARSPHGTYTLIWDPKAIAHKGSLNGARSYGNRSPFFRPELGFPTTVTTPREIPPGKLVSPRNYPLLHFWTISCFFKIEAIDTDCFRALVGANDEKYGKLIFDGFEQPDTAPPRLGIRSWWREATQSRRKKNTERSTPYLAPREIILLSESQQDWPSTGYGCKTTDSWSFYNIMLLKWDSTGSVAERRGIGSIPMEVITKGFPPGPFWKEILLG